LKRLCEFCGGNCFVPQNDSAMGYRNAISKNRNWKTVPKMPKKCFLPPMGAVSFLVISCLLRICVGKDITSTENRNQKDIADSGNMETKNAF